MELARRRPLLAAVAAAAALVVAGCGDDEESDTGAQDTATEQTETEGAAGGGGATLDMSAVEFDFEPADPTIDEDGPVTINLANEGELPHALTIEETDDSTETIDGGQSTTLEADLDSGEYTIFCPVGDHREQGMEGTLTVGGGGSGEDDSGSEDSESEDSESEDDDSESSGGSGGGY